MIQSLYTSYEIFADLHLKFVFYKNCAFSGINIIIQSRQEIYRIFIRVEETLTQKCYVRSETKRKEKERDWKVIMYGMTVKFIRRRCTAALHHNNITNSDGSTLCRRIL